MIKEKLMQALKVAAADYNGGMGADAAVAKAAEAADFNEHQTERLVEMFNTLAAINKEKDAEDPTGICELADKGKVAKILLDGNIRKAASADAPDLSQYAFYSMDPEKSNRIMEARDAGMAKVASDMSAIEQVPDELNVSSRSLFKMITDKIELLKSAGDAADYVVRQLQLETERCAIKIAKAIEDLNADAEMADLFKAACANKKAVELISEYSTKVAESDGGRFARMEVYDTGMVDNLLKTAEELEGYLGQIPVFEKKRDFYVDKAAESENSVMEILGLVKKQKQESMADFFKVASAPMNVAGVDDKTDREKEIEEAIQDADLSVKIAELVKKSGISSEEVEKLASDLEKDAAVPRSILSIPIPSVGAMSDSLSKNTGIDGERQILLNVRRAMLLSDLMSNDPIIRCFDITKRLLRRGKQQA